MFDGAQLKAAPAAGPAACCWATDSRWTPPTPPAVIRSARLGAWGAAECVWRRTIAAPSDRPPRPACRPACAAGTCWCSSKMDHANAAALKRGSGGGHAARLSV